MPAKKKHIKYADITKTLTVTVGALADALVEAGGPHGVTVRLRTATIAMFEIGGIERLESGRVWLCIGHCLNNPRASHGVYPPLDPEKLVDVGVTATTPQSIVELLEAESLPVRGWSDMRLSDLAKPYEDGRKRQ